MADRRLALKLYRPGRDPADVRWEVDLVRHLAGAGVSVAEPVRVGPDWLVPVVHEGAARMAVLWEWVAGAKPTASTDTYVLLGVVAGRIHRAADSFVSAWPRETYDTETLIEDQLRRMRPVLLAVDRWRAASTSDPVWRNGSPTRVLTVACATST